MRESGISAQPNNCGNDDGDHEQRSEYVLVGGEPRLRLNAELEKGTEFLEPETSAVRAELLSVRMSDDGAGEEGAVLAALNGAEITFCGVALPAAAA